MADNTVLETVDSLIDSLDDVEEAFEPLLSKSLQDSLDSADGPIERAKILFWLAYAIHSCTWAFTKTAAVDPEEHGVLEELERIKRYNGKIVAAVKRAESTANGASSNEKAAPEDERKRMPLDKEAASRFIKAGIANQPSKPSGSSAFYAAEATVSDPLAGPGPHSRLSSLSRASTAKETDGSGAASGSDSDSDVSLKIYASMVHATSGTNGNDGPQAEGSSAAATSIAAPKGDAEQVEADKKKRRQEKKRKRLLGVNSDSNSSQKIALDPLQGYDNADSTGKQSKKAKVQQLDEQSQSSRASSVNAVQTDSVDGSASTSSKQTKKKRKKRQEAA